MSWNRSGQVRLVGGVGTRCPEEQRHSGAQKGVPRGNGEGSRPSTVSSGWPGGSERQWPPLSQGGAWNF